MAKLTPRELRFLKLIYPDGTVSIGLAVGEVLHSRGYLTLGRDRRYSLTRKGLIAVAASAAKPAQSQPAEPASE